MRIVAGKAVARRLIVHVATVFHLAVAREAQLGGCRCQQLDARDVFCDSHFMTAQAVLLRRRMRVLIFRLILMASDAGGRCDVRIKSTRMLLPDSETCQENNDDGREKLRDRRLCINTRV